MTATRRSALLLAVMVLAACGSARTASAPSTTTAPPIAAVRVTTALGDSVPHGTACDCTPYPQLNATDLTHAAGHAVETANDAADGFTTADVDQQLNDDSAVETHVATSQMVMVEAGANDVAHSAECGTNLSCYTPTVPEIEKNLDAIVARVHHLAGGHPLTVVMLDYWSVWLGGQYAKAQGPAYTATADALTDDVSDVIQAVAKQTHSIFVDLRTAFRGPSREYDETHLLAPDGDHPNAEGHQRIAQAIEAALNAS